MSSYKGTTCSSCGGPGHRAPTCGRFDHYECPECHQRYTRYPRFGYCPNEFSSNGTRVQVKVLEDDYRPTTRPASNAIDLQEIVTIATGVAEAKVNELASNLEATYVDSITQNADKLENISSLVKENAISVIEGFNKYEKVAKSYESEVNKLRDLVNSTVRVETIININETKVELTDEFVSPLLPELLIHANAGITGVMIKGPAGCGKSYSAQQLHRVLEQTHPGIEFLPLSFTEGLTESDFYGRLMPDGTFIESKILKGYESATGILVLADELDAGDPNLIMILNRMVEYDEIYNPRNGRTYHRGNYFFVVAAVNTFGRGGDVLYTRNRLDASTLDRFSQVLEADYNKELERKLCPDTLLLEAMWSIREYLQINKLLEFVSTRKIATAYKVVAAGLDRNTAIENTIRPWELVVKEAVRKLDAFVKASMSNEYDEDKDFILDPHEFNKN